MKRLIIFIFVFLLVSCSEQEENEKLVFADGISFWTAPTILASELDFFIDENVSVNVVRYTTGLAAKNAVVSNSADIGIVATTPLAGAMIHNEKYRIVGTYFASEHVLGLVRAVTDQAGKNAEYLELTDSQILKFFETQKQVKIGIVAGTISEIFLDNLIAKLEIDPKKIQKVALSPANMSQALIKGDIEFASLWEPFLLKVQQNISKIGNIAIRWSGDEYTVKLHLVVSERAIQSADKRKQIVKFLKAIDKSSKYIISEDTKTVAQSKIEEFSNFRIGSLDNTWKVSGPDGNGTLKFGFALPDEYWEKGIIEDISNEIKWMNKDFDSFENIKRRLDSSLLNDALSE